MPPSQTSSPSPKPWTSKPMPVRTEVAVGGASHGEILLEGELVEPLVTRDHRDGDTGIARHLRVVGRGRRLGPAAMRGEDRREAEGLRRLDPDDGGPVDRIAQRTAAGGEAVDHRQDGHRALVVVERRRAGGRSPPSGRPGRAASWISTRRQPPSRDRLEPGVHRLLARVAAA